MDENIEISNCPTTAILALMRIPDEEVKALTVQHVENLLKEKTPAGGTKWIAEIYGRVLPAFKIDTLSLVSLYSTR